MIEGPTVYLRALEPQDIDLLYHWENDTSLWVVSNTLTPFSRFILEQYVINSQQDIYTAKQLRMMIVRNEDDLAVGTIDLFDFDPFHKRAGLGIMVLEEHRRKGYALETLELMKSYCFDTLMLHQLYGNIAEDNKSSIDLFTAAGYSVCGTKRQWLADKNGWKDEHIFQLINTI
ncbi:MAG: GNAT family N-acetyltransferase [Bacteroidales bacterium]